MQLKREYKSHHEILDHSINLYCRFCFRSNGEEVELLVETEEPEEHTDEEHEHTESEESTGERSCHFHAGVE
jgi:hypothetical protein